MGFLKEQLTMRRELDEQMFENSFQQLSEVITGPGKTTASMEQNQVDAQRAIEEIFRYLRLDLIDVPDDLKSMNERLEFMLRPTGVMRRRVELTDHWYRDGIGPLLGSLKDGTVIALLPSVKGYRYYDKAKGKYQHVTSRIAKNIELDAFCFYKAFPQKSLNIADLVWFIARSLSPWDYAKICLMTLVVTLIGMVTPFATQRFFQDVIPLGKMETAAPVAIFLIAALIAQSLFSVTNKVLSASIETKMNIQVKSAAMARLLNLPASFFNGYSSGELASRLSSVSELCSVLKDAILSSSLTSIFSLVYVAQMWSYAPAMVLPTIIVLLLNVAYTILSSYLQINHQRDLMKASAKLQGIVFALISGIQKIKLANAEKRMFARWAGFYKEKAHCQYHPPLIIKLGSTISVIFSFGALLVIFASAALAQVDTASYMAFYAAYGMVSSALLQLGGIANSVAEIKPMLEMVNPIMKTAPELSPNRKPLTKLRGSVELNHVSFAYQEDGPNVIDDLSLSIKANQYVAIVGKTGCGKSTLIRLMLGFEKPQKGAVYYDAKELESLDIRSVRRNIGVVLQNGKLMAGDIYSNVIVSAPWLTVDEAMEALDMAGMSEDIANMPMGIRTLISEGSGGISGGQKQRLMIARAIAPKPRILIFDEATSALDNITQNQVAQSLDRLRCTRIVIAHRLSTIRKCDRIIFLDKGRIVEDGTFDELVALNGQFAEMVNRQMV